LWWFVWDHGGGTTFLPQWGLQIEVCWLTRKGLFNVGCNLFVVGFGLLCPELLFLSMGQSI
jgi:hypothetical protein